MKKLYNEISENNKISGGVLLAITIILCLIWLTSCCPKQIEKITTVTKIDTVFVKKNIYDTLNLSLTPNITVLDTNKVLLNPFIASIDSLIKVGNKDVKIKASYNQPNNKFIIDIAQSWLDSIMKIKQVDTIKQNTVSTEYVNRVDWYMYIIFGVLLIIAVGVGSLFNFRK